MQQFARVLTENGVIPVIRRGDEHLDLRPIVSDITPDAIASGALTAVDTTGLSPVHWSIHLSRADQWRPADRGYRFQL